ncbi:hypothetical protein JCM21900_003725 [Sporobolomyces salmonicolor]
MLFTTCPSASRPSTTLLVLIGALLTLVHTTTALPTVRTAAAFEPLFRPASSQVGPTRSIERLRLRRALGSVIGRRSPEEQPSTPALDKRAGAAVRNPKTKRSTRALERRALGLPAVVSNPKAKRSSAVNSAPSSSPSSTLQRRAFAGLPSLVVNRKKRAVVSASISVTAHVDALPSRRSFTSVSTLFRRFLGTSQSVKQKRGVVGTLTVGKSSVVRVVPNPKYAASSASSPSSSASSSTIWSSVSTTTTTIAPTTPSKASTTVEASTTSKASTTPKATTTSVAWTTAETTTTATTTSSAATSTSTWPASGGMIAGGYYPDWEGDNLPPESINYKLFDLINFSFAVPTSDNNVEFTQDNSGDLLNRLVKLAHGNNTKVLIAIGGWSDSEYFSNAVSSSSNRKTFVNNIVSMVNKYNVDGVDIDWEYPGTQGAAGNEVSTSDTANLLLFLKALRAALPNKRLSTCTTQQAYIGANGSPLTNVAAYAAVLDNILVMNYDVWGASSTPGPNAPLEDSCSGSMQPNANELSAIQAWTAAGMPASKILMGIPAYGYISSSTATTLVHKRDSIPSTGLSNRHLAKLKRQERYMSEGHKRFIAGQARAAARRKAKRDLERGRKVVDVRSIPQKRDTIIVCPNDHSGNPCKGITGQNISMIAWNPLANSTLDSGSSNSSDGVFGGSGGVKVGNGDVSSFTGNQIDFNQLISYGVIVKNGVNFVGANGYTRKWDDCSSTPYLYDTSRKVVVTYDDPYSLGLKGQLAYNQSIAGLAMWDMSGDTADFQLTQSWRSSMGLAALG